MGKICNKELEMKNKKKIFLIALLSALIFSSFCFAIDLREEIKERKIPTYIIENTSYVSLKSLLHILNCEDSWGRVEDRVFIAYDGGEMKFKLGGQQVFFGKRTENIDAPIKEIEGEILVPVDDFSEILSGVERKSGPSKPSVADRTKEKTSKTSWKKEKFTVIIDPGHGGDDRGAVGYYGLREKDVNLDIALRMADYLRKELRKFPKVKIYMTRNTDVFISLEERVQMAKDIDADVFFSIHANSSRNMKPDADGFETYYSGEKENLVFLPASSNVGEGVDDDGGNSTLSSILEDLSTTSAVDESRVLADFVQERLAERLLCPDRGTKRRNFYVLRYTPMPAILTEVGFLCNPKIELNLKDMEVRQAIAETLGNALTDYLKFRGVISD